jgi:membrane protein implicated in regulation of membrane protease activity
MSAVTLAFLGLGGLSLLLLLLSLRFRRIGHFRFLHRIRPPRWLRPRHGDTAYTLPAFSGFLGGFGFGGAIAVEALHHTGAQAVVTGSVAGLIVGAPLAWAAARLVRAVDGMPTDATPESAGLVGATGVVVSEIPSGGLGQVRLSYAGQPMKFNARADAPLGLGARVLVIGVPTPSSVLVTPLDQLLTSGEEGS